MLRGSWRIVRTIGAQGALRGAAAFTEIAPGLLHYREDGILCLPDGSSFESFREYRYRLENETIRVAFADGRPFHDLAFTSPVRAVGSHACGGDFYAAAYAFSPPGGFTLEWTVTGLRKNYVMLTKFEK